MNTETLATTETIFVNLYAKIKEEKAKELQQFTTGLNENKDVNTMLESWHYTDLLPASKKYYKWELNELKDYLVKRKAKAIDKYLAKQLLHLQAVEKASHLETITVSVEWKKSRMWGSNPTANARVCDKEYGHNYVSGSIGGCGYDKESTAIAEVINQSNSFLKAMYQLKEQNPNKSNHDVFGYGSGYGILPRLEGGVGVSCYPRIFEKIGFLFKNTASGKTFDVYAVTKL